MQQLDKRTVWLFFIGYISRGLGPIFVMGVYIFTITSPLRESYPSSNLLDLNGLPWLWLFFPIYIIGAYVWATLSYHYYQYELIESGFRKDSGVISKKSVTIPYDRIQNIDIHRGLVARLLGLSDLQIQTAGSSTGAARRGIFGGDAEGRLPGLAKDVAEKLRDELIGRTQQHKQQGL